ncbi:hypothetical protein DPMN_011666 [Dreissena polymorpha]|uniref:Uncharacterized protein n=2 Tax=Dreissena polymorpha TaxID=45954 RepID=A0A9D4N4F3_DREPO|nr:hypothetical protein DPMN_011666 [Dreissena polymorpha]
MSATSYWRRFSSLSSRKPTLADIDMTVDVEKGQLVSVNDTKKLSLNLSSQIGRMSFEEKDNEDKANFNKHVDAKKQCKEYPLEEKSEHWGQRALHASALNSRRSLDIPEVVADTLDRLGDLEFENLMRELEDSGISSGYGRMPYTSTPQTASLSSNYEVNTARDSVQKASGDIPRRSFKLSVNSKQNHEQDQSRLFEQYEHVVHEFETGSADALRVNRVQNSDTGAGHSVANDKLFRSLPGSIDQVANSDVKDHESKVFKNLHSSLTLTKPPPSVNNFMEGDMDDEVFVSDNNIQTAYSNVSLMDEHAKEHLRLSLAKSKNINNGHTVCDGYKDRCNPQTNNSPKHYSLHFADARNNKSNTDFSPNRPTSARGAITTSRSTVTGYPIPVMSSVFSAHEVGLTYAQCKKSVGDGSQFAGDEFEAINFSEEEAYRRQLEFIHGSADVDILDQEFV